MKRFSLVIFDCDGVLVDSEPIAAQAYTAVYARHGVDLPASVMRGCVGMKQNDIRDLIAAETGYLLPEDGQKQIWHEIEQQIKKRLQPTAGIGAFLAKSVISRCVASSSSLERIALSLSVTGLAAQFSANRIFSSSMVKHGKPAPDLFLHAARQCETPPGACAVFEDSIPGIRAAVAAGMTPFGYAGGSHCLPNHNAALLEAGAVKVFASWQDAMTFEDMHLGHAPAAGSIV